MLNLPVLWGWERCVLRQVEAGGGGEGGGEKGEGCLEGGRSGGGGVGYGDAPCTPFPGAAPPLMWCRSDGRSGIWGECSQV